MPPSHRRHVEPGLHDCRIRDRLSARLVHETHRDGGFVARLDFGLDGLERVIVGAGERVAGKARCNRECGAGDTNFLAISHSS